VLVRASELRSATFLATAEQLGRCVNAHEGEPLFPGLGRRAQWAVNDLAVIDLSKRREALFSSVA